VGNNFLKREPACVTKKPTKVAGQGRRNSGSVCLQDMNIHSRKTGQYSNIIMAD